MTDPEELTQGNVFIPFSTTPNWVRGGSEGNKNSKTKNAAYTLILIDLLEMLTPGFAELFKVFNPDR